MPRQTLEILPRRFNPFHRRKCFDLRRKKIKVTLRFVDGVIAQLVERLNGIQEVRSSSLLGSTILNIEKDPCSPCGTRVFSFPGESCRTGLVEACIGLDVEQHGAKQMFMFQGASSASSAPKNLGA